MQWTILPSEAESLCQPPNLDNLAASGQQPLTEEEPQLQRADRAWQDSHSQQPQHSHLSTFPATVDHIETALADLPQSRSQLSLPIVTEEPPSSAINLPSSGGTTRRMRPLALRGRRNVRSTRGSFPPHRAHFDETAEPVDQLVRGLPNCHVPQRSELFHGDTLSSTQMQSSVQVDVSSPAAQRSRNGRRRGAGSGRRRELPDFGNTRAVPFGGTPLQDLSSRPTSCAMSEPFRVSLGDGRRRHFSPSGLLQSPFAGVGSVVPGNSGSFIRIDRGQPALPEASLEPQEPAERRRQHSYWSTLHDSHDMNNERYVEPTLPLYAISSASRRDSCDEAACIEPSSQLVALVQCTVPHERFGEDQQLSGTHGRP